MLLGPPWGPRHSHTEGSQKKAFSHERGNSVRAAQAEANRRLPPEAELTGFSSNLCACYSPVLLPNTYTR